MKIVVIGGGPGGYVAAIRAAQLGAEVTIIEKERLGGTCLNIGCIPTKALVDSAHVYHLAGHSIDIGIEAKPKLVWEKVQERRANIVNTLVSGVEGLMRANKIKVVYGKASFKNKTTIEVVGSDGKKEEVKADKTIIATGSVPMVAPIEGADFPFCIDSTDALSLNKVPKSMVIVGGGVIGVEFACAYHEFGTKVTIVEMMDRILPNMDSELVAKLHEQLTDRGIDILTSAKVSKFAKDGENGVCTLSHEGKEKTLKAEKVLLCLGRKSYTEGLNLKAVGVKEERSIIADEYLRTSVAEIYAIGDCNGQMLLAHVASEQGVVAAENAMGANHKYDGSVCPSGIYSFPELASVGLTEEAAKAKGLEYDTGFFPTMANGRSLIARESAGGVKVIIGKKHREVLGVHILGSQATELIGQAAIAMKMEATTEEIIETIHSHPTLSECIHEAILNSENKTIHMPNRKK